MSAQPDTIQPKLDALTGLLDRQIELVTRRIEQLQTLSDSLTRRDENRLEALLEEINKTGAQQESADRQLAQLRNALAEAFGLSPEQMRLGDLIERVDGPRRDELAGRRVALQELCGVLRERHLQSVMLISESARINRDLLSCLFPDKQEVTTYNTTGSDNWQDGAGLVDAEL